MKKTLITLLALALITVLTALTVNAHAFTLPAGELDEARYDNNFEHIFVDHFFPSLTPAQVLVFGAELGISNGRPQNENGERYMFGRLENADSAIKTKDPEQIYERVRDECIRLLFGPWAEPGFTTLQLVERRGEALNLTTGKWRPYSGLAFLVRHTTEYFGGSRSRLLALDVTSGTCNVTICNITIMRVK